MTAYDTDGLIHSKYGYFFQFKKYLLSFLQFIYHIYLFKELINHGFFTPCHWVGEILGFCLRYGPTKAQRYLT